MPLTDRELIAQLADEDARVRHAAIQALLKGGAAGRSDVIVAVGTHVEELETSSTNILLLLDLFSAMLQEMDSPRQTNFLVMILAMSENEGENPKVVTRARELVEQHRGHRFFTFAQVQLSQLRREQCQA